MTSRSPRSRRTTAWPTTPARTGISLALLAGLAAGPAAADPPWAKSPTAPQWATPNPTAKPPAAEPAPPVPPAVALPTVLPPATLPPAAPQARTVYFQKQPGDGQPGPRPDGAQDTPKADAKAPPVANELPKTGTGLPDKRNLFRLEGDEALERRILTELERPQDRFPRPPQVGEGQTYVPKTASYPPMQAVIEPAYVVHRPLYFEEKNAERYGWDFGLAQPAISTMYFWGDFLLWPSRLASNVCERYDTSAGKCLPGDPVPYYLYPPNITASGGLFGAGVITAASFVIFP